MKLFALVAASAVFVCAQAPRQLPINNLPPDTIVATSDGKPITAGEIAGLLAIGDPKMINLATMDPDQFLGSIFLMRYLTGEADKIHLAEESPWKEQLQYVRNQIIASAMVNRMRETYYVPEEAVEDFYKKNSDRYEQAWIKVIVIRSCAPMPKPAGTSDAALKDIAKGVLEHNNCDAKRDDAEGMAFAQKIMARIRAGEDFVKLVKEYSEDGDSKATDGDFGLVTRTSSYKDEIKSAVFSLKDGEVSEPVRSGNYLYIIKIKEHSVQPLTAVREPIVQDLKQKHFTEWMQQMSVRLKPTIERPDFFVKPTDPKPKGPAQLVPQP
jgi:peptidyl-prolyl cis-trans isomerase C